MREGLIVDEVGLMNGVRPMKSLILGPEVDGKGDG